MNRLAPILVAALTGGCSFLLDFDNETDLPCDCLPSHVCLRSTNRCVLKRSVDPFKSCNRDADTPDDLCLANHICYNFGGRGDRCLPRCTPSNYSTPETGAYLRQQCPVGTTCWPIPEGGGVCDEGECTENPNTCPPPAECVTFNGAGVCFTPCAIFQPDACAGDEICHPIGSSNSVACIKAGNTMSQEPCDDMNTCAQADGLARAMVCDRPENSGDLRRCLASCMFPGNTECVAGEECAFARANVDPQTGANLGVCIQR